jgi:hypothetical protein
VKRQGKQSPRQSVSGKNPEADVDKVGHRRLRGSNPRPTCGNSRSPAPVDVASSPSNRLRRGTSAQGGMIHRSAVSRPSNAAPSPVRPTAVDEYRCIRRSSRLGHQLLTPNFRSGLGRWFPNPSISPFAPSRPQVPTP